jgi:hypothetical protein
LRNTIIVLKKTRKCFVYKSLPGTCTSHYPSYSNLHFFKSTIQQVVVVVNRMADKQNAKYFKCDTCNYSTTQRGHLNQHTNLVHLKVKNFKCTQCSYKCGTNQHLQMHILTVHLKRRDFQCDACDYSTIERSKLNKTEKASSHKPRIFP